MPGHRLTAPAQMAAVAPPHAPQPAFASEADVFRSRAAAEEAVREWPGSKVKQPEPEQLVLVLDLDECLVHSCLASASDMGQYRQVEDRPTEVSAEGLESFLVQLDTELVRVIKRPGLDAFLDLVCQRYEVYVFTAGVATYASTVVRQLDPEGERFRGVLYRDSCSLLPSGVYVKDLRVFGPDLSRVVLVDNNMISFLANPCNGVPVPSFFCDPADDQLERVAALLVDHLEAAHDVREPLRSIFSLRTELSGYMHLLSG